MFAKNVENLFLKKIILLCIHASMAAYIHLFAMIAVRLSRGSLSWLIMVGCMAEFHTRVLLVEKNFCRREHF